MVNKRCFFCLDATQSSFLQQASNCCYVRTTLWGAHGDAGQDPWPDVSFSQMFKRLRNSEKESKSEWKWKKGIREWDEQALGSMWAVYSCNTFLEAGRIWRHRWLRGDLSGVGRATDHLNNDSFYGISLKNITLSVSCLSILEDVIGP